MIIENNLLKRYFGKKEFAFPEKTGVVTSEFCGKTRIVGDYLTVFVAKEDIRLPMYSNSGSYVKIGDEIRGLLPEQLTATFNKGSIVKYGEWVKNPEWFSRLKAVKVKICKIYTRARCTGHEFYEIEFYEI